MLAWYRKKKRDEEFLRRIGWLLSERDRARIHREQLAIHFRSFFELLPGALFHTMRYAMIQAKNVLVFRRLLKRNTFGGPPV